MHSGFNIKRIHALRIIWLFELLNWYIKLGGGCPPNVPLPNKTSFYISWLLLTAILQPHLMKNPKNTFFTSTYNITLVCLGEAAAAEAAVITKFLSLRTASRPAILALNSFSIAWRRTSSSCFSFSFKPLLRWYSILLFLQKKLVICNFEKLHSKLFRMCMLFLFESEYKITEVNSGEIYTALKETNLKVKENVTYFARQ